ncbi:ABC transporter substrate-binding protein [Anaerocolumna sp. AGMB13025]|uniref:ABC transporter substrate-binding protein n=1 Tax=Anaerocolumna sp. AGMB13025 TaxID=3039116 RepID=UPI00241D2562|nr:ABC transporter substrate-binding protein [Anaerocolumna sp. AGMB13025]WFR58874.1 ABC transporter substrate-binding protein [Anaerocolumna sp. AGMB13025]
MRKKIISVLLCLGMVASLLSGCSGSKQGDKEETGQTKNDTATTQESSAVSDGSKYKDFITVDVFDQLANYQGIQTGWFAKIVKDKFNMELNIISPNVAGGGETLYQTRSAAGNLGDLIIYPMSGGKLQDLVEAKLIVDMTDMMNGKKNLEKYKDAIDFSNQNNSTTPGTWGIPSEVSENPATQPLGGTTLNFGTYLRWDLYKQMGYPEMKTMEDLLPVMKQMQDMNVVSDAGKKAYAFSFFKDWDGAFMNIATQIPSYYGYGNTGFLWQKADDSAEPQSTLDSDSLYIRGLKFFYQANQMGLVDPDSTTQSYDTVYNKYVDGAILWSPWPWLSAGYNSDKHKGEGKLFDTAAINDFKLYTWGCYAKGNPGVGMMIGSEAKDKERLMDFIDWYYSPEAITLITTGAEGVTWDMADNQPKLTDLGYQCMTDPANTDMPQEQGGGKYKDGMSQLNYKTISAGEVNPDTGFPYDYSLWDSFTQKSLSDIEKDWQTHMAAKNAVDYFTKNNQIVVSPGSGFSTPAEASDITTIRNQIQEVIKEYSWKAVFAKNETEFNQYIKDMQDTALGLGYDKVLAVDKANAEAQKQARAAVVK